jgi:LCP family protein required for cell wall assembly
VGGAGHDGPQLTDTIIFASVRPSDKAIGMMSVPRDLTVPVADGNWRKINAVNALAEAEKKGSGPAAMAKIVSSILNQDIYYYFKVDFDGFAELIDELGGLDIYVENSFSDNEYPLNDMEEADCGTTIASSDENGAVVETPDYSCRFTTVSFQAGWTQMDGATALTYVRSRHGSNGEASDFARSQRQQNLLIALKEKILSLNTLSHPSKISSVLRALEDHIQTNLTLGEFLTLGRKYGGVDREKITNQVLDTADDSPLYATFINGAYVILPRNDDWSGVQNLAANIFSAETNQGLTTAPRPRLAKVEIQNGTTIAGLAFQASQLLSAQGFDIVKISNAADCGYEKTIVYDLTNGQKADLLKDLQNTLKAEAAKSATGWIYSGEIVPKEISLTDEPYASQATANEIDFLIILGEDNSDLVKK